MLTRACAPAFALFAAAVTSAWAESPGESAGQPAAVIFDNSGPNGGWNPLGASPASQRDPLFPFDAAAADDFLLPASPLCTWSITGVRWTGVYWGPDAAPAISGFRIAIWPDEGGVPAGGLAPTADLSKALAVFDLPGAAGETPGPIAGSFAYAASLPVPFQAPANVRYWLSIQPTMAFPPQWGWSVTHSRRGAGPVEYFDLLGLPAWTAIPDTGDLAFELLGEPAAIACDDGNACTADACDGGECVFTPIACNDNNACTQDSCDSASGCVHAAISCDDADACTNDSCDPATGCVHPAVVCDDGDSCTSDSCDAATGCVFTQRSCEDGDACTSDACIDGECVHTAPPDFDGDGDVDTADFATFATCLAGASAEVESGCLCGDLTGDGMVDMHDVAMFQAIYTGTP